MSKDAEKPADLDAGKSAGERRPRKRRGGLRIPSDNVPRAATEDSSAPVPPAVSDDPKLAVSVAVAFGSEPSAPAAVAAAEGEEDQAAADEDSGVHEANGEDSHGIPVPVEDDISEPELVVGSDDGELDDDDEFDDEVDNDDEFDDEFDDAMTPPPTERASIVRVAPRGAAQPGSPSTSPPTPSPAATPSAPAVDLGALAGDDEVEVPGVGRSGDSVEIAFDDEELAQQAREVGRISRPPRAQTMALSEDDLEEVMDEVGGTGQLAARRAAAREADDLDSRKTLQMQAVRPEDLPPELRDSLAEPESVPDATPPPPASPRASSEAEPQPSEQFAEQLEEAEPTVAQAPPSEAAPTAMQDAGDSGEIISDDSDRRG